MVDEVGAVTVDWVVLNATVVEIAFAVMTIISGGLKMASLNIKADIITKAVAIT